MQYFCISVHFLDGLFHGQTGQDRGEWPPSPLRLFQSLLFRFSIITLH
jgi:CRISPR-associated protein Csb2